MRLVIYPDDRLRQKAAAVGEVTVEVREMLAEMRVVMLDSRGIGLAAPQIGIRKRMFVADMDGSHPLFFVDPVIRPAGRALSSLNEGCLSLPGAWGEVIRPSEVVVSFVDLDGRPSEMKCSGILATVVQHETDHLDGILHIDRMESFRRRMAVDGLWNSLHQKK